MTCTCDHCETAATLATIRTWTEYRVGSAGPDADTVLLCADCDADPTIDPAEVWAADATATTVRRGVGA